MNIGAVIDYFIQNPYLLFVGFLLYVFIFGLSILFSGPKPSRNPFSAKYVHPAEPLVTDQITRDKVLKQKFKPQRVPNKLDAIVIGSGIGGLSVAVMMSRVGKKVLVLEQHDQAGGCCHTFHDKGFEFDTGIHYIGKMGEGMDGRIFTDQLTSGRMVYPLMDEEFDVVTVGDYAKAKRYPMPADRKKYEKYLIEKFPKEEKAIKKFMSMLLESKSAFMGFCALKMMPKWLAGLLTQTGIYSLIFKSYNKYFKTSLKDVLESLTDNEELKCVLSYIFGDYGVLPSKSTFAFHAVIINHYMNGSYYIRGGPSEIAFQMIPTIERHGGAVLVKAPVSQILLDSKGKAVGVKVSRKGVEMEIFAKQIVSDAGVANTFLRLLPQEVATKSCLYPLISKVGESLSFLTVFVGLDGSQEELGIKANNTWAYVNPEIEKSMNEYTSLSLEDAAEAECPMMFVSFPSAKDPTWAERNPTKSTCLIITLAKYEWFTRWEDEKVKKRGGDYDGLKNAIGKQLWNQCVQLYPKLEGRVEYFDVGTPLSNKYYLGFGHGEMYGLDHNQERFTPEVAMHLRPKTDIPGLYLTGQDIGTVGFSGAMFGGLLCASELLHRNLYKDLTNLVKEIKKNK